MYVVCQMATGWSTDTSNTIVSGISAILSDMTTCRVFFRADFGVFLIRPFCSNIDEGCAARLHVHISVLGLIKGGNILDNLLVHIVFGHQMRHASFGSALYVYP